MASVSLDSPLNPVFPHIPNAMADRGVSHSYKAHPSWPGKRTENNTVMLIGWYEEIDQSNRAFHWYEFIAVRCKIHRPKAG